MNIAIYIYNGAEVLDFAGPFEVFSTAARVAGHEWNLFLVAETDTVIHGRGGFPVVPHYSIQDHPAIDVLMVAGGVHDDEIRKDPVVEWIARVGGSADLVASVCTGSFLLAEAGLLPGMAVTTHWEDFDRLQSAYPHLDTP